MKAEGKRIYVKALLITLISLMCSVRAWSQAGVIYPVDINVTLTPPYGTCLTDLTNSDRFRIQALMRDMSHPEYKMVIQMMIRDLTSLSPVFISTTNAFSLTAGEPTKVIGRDVSFASIADFFNYQNIRVGMQYVGTKCLPEGAYLFSFQAYDVESYRTNRIPISREVTFSAFLEGGEVPILTYPAQNDSIECGVKSIHFTWMQPFVSSGVNTYRLQVLKSNTEFPLPAKELLDNPNTNDRLEVITLIPSYPFHDVSNFLEENKTYYWRVVMCDAEGNARLSYPNKGASEIRSFVYCGEKIIPEPDPDADWVQKKPQVKSIKDNLDVVDLIKAEEDGPNVVRAFCKKDDQEIREKYSGIIVEVKKKSHDTWTPFNIESQSVEDTSVSLGNLAYNELYEARAQYYINEGESTTYAPYSETIEFTISNPADTIECGSPLPELNSDCTEAPKELKEGDKFSANGANVTVLEITSQSVEGNKLKISGTGYVNFPILRNFKLKVKFENAVLNCNLQLEDGTVESVYDLSTAATIDLNNLLGKGAGGYDLPETDPSIIDVPDINPDDPSTCDACKSYESGTLFTDGGQVYMKGEDDAIINVGKEIDLSSSGEYKSNETRKDKVLVWFSNPDPANIAFDNDSMGYYRSIASINDQYTLFATNYITPWVANNPGRVVTLAAKPDDDFKKSGYTDLKFVLKTSGTNYVELNNQLNSDGTYSVAIPGTDPSNITHIYAIARPAAGKPYENVGQLKVASYEKKTQKVILVPVANADPKTEDVKAYLTSVYGKLGYSFEVEVDNDKSHVEGINSDQISISSGVFTQYSDEMSSVINTYTSRLGDSYDKSAAYLFLMKKASGDNASVGGIMPQKHQFGFIFLGGTKDVDNRTIAHELGHGLWGLDHTFVKAYKIPEGTTPHLMDYNNGVYLAHFEWSQIDKPVLSWALMNSDKDNEDFDPTSCAIKVVGGMLIDAGFELYSQYNESKDKGGIDGFSVLEAGLAGAPARLLDCVDIRKFKKVWTALTDVIFKYKKAYGKCKREEAIKFDSYDHCMCEEIASIFTDQVIGIIVGELIGDVKKPEGKSKKEALEYFVQLVYPDFTVDYFSSKASEVISETFCGRNPYVKKDDSPTPGKLYCGMPYYYIEREDADGLISIGINTISDYSNETPLGLLNLDKEITWTENYCDPETRAVEFISDNSNTPIYENIYIPSELSNNIDIEFIKNDEYKLPHYKVKNTSDMAEDVLYLVNEIEYDYDATELLKLYVLGNDGKPSYKKKVHIKTCVYKLKPSCLSPHNDKNYINVSSTFSARIKLAQWYDELLGLDYYMCTSGNLCGQKIPEDDDTPKSVYPKYLDDECNCNDPAYMKNPFGQIKQTGPNKYENASPRETIEGKSYEFGNLKLEYGIPKCSGWKFVKEEDGCKIYNVSPRVKCGNETTKYIPNLYTVTVCNNKIKDIKQNNVNLSPYAFEILEYWHDKYCIVLDNGNNNYVFMDLQEFCNIINSKDVLIDAFITMYACWEYKFVKSGSTQSVGVSNTIPDLKDYVRSIYRLISLSNKNTNILPGIDKVNIKFIENTRDLLPPNVLQDIKDKLNGKKLKIEFNDLKKCPANCVFADIMLKTAEAFAEIKYNENVAKPFADNKYGVGKADDDLKVQNEVLMDYLSILGWKLYCGKISEGVNYHGMEMGSWRNPPYGILELSDKGARLFKYTPGLDPDNAKIKTFPDVLMKYLEGKKCK